MNATTWTPEKTYFGSGVQSKNYPDLVICSLCLSDIPQRAIEHSGNGKDYARFVISKRRETGKYWETHAIYVKPKEDNQQAPQTWNAVAAAAPEDDLPFN